jgi:peptide deformylase
MPERPVVAVPNPSSSRPRNRSAGSIADLAADLVDTMRVSPGCVGLAAPQIG